MGLWSILRIPHFQPRAWQLFRRRSGGSKAKRLPHGFPHAAMKALNKIRQSLGLRLSAVVGVTYSRLMGL
ncbi:hypothetical protein AK812_SmicGene11733 [Symbiodinium microadriaticum]|uniref:Uncharacterized protein n=1 Tax=Symbiodinium microadriaticum TaxID=2951 RepID=A0A1Q9ECD2_SYMMI|nr:hypothetical protein AK812_SmicGene11733 [Symbiodinium microadriaticum]